MSNIVTRENTQPATNRDATDLAVGACAVGILGAVGWGAWSVWRAWAGLMYEWNGEMSTVVWEAVKIFANSGGLLAVGGLVALLNIDVALTGNVDEKDKIGWFGRLLCLGGALVAGYGTLMANWWIIAASILLITIIGQYAPRTAIQTTAAPAPEITEEPAPQVPASAATSASQEPNQ